MGKFGSLVHVKGFALVRRVTEPMAAMQLIPDRSLRNYQVDSLAKAMTEFYTRPLARVRPGFPVTIQGHDRFVFRVTLQAEAVNFLLYVPARLADYFRQKTQATWDKATVTPVETELNLTPDRCKCCELTYRRHDIFALATDRDTNSHLPGVLAATRDMRPGDMVVVDILFLATDRVNWEYDAGRAYERFQAGRMPRRVQVSPVAAMSAGFGLVNLAMAEVQRTIVEGMGGDSRRGFTPMDPEREALAVRGLSTATTAKIHSPVLRTHIRIISQASDPERAALTMRAVAGAYKDITSDNELVQRSRSAPGAVKEVLECRAPMTGGIMVSTAEAGKLMSLPTGGLQEEFPQVESVGHREVALPAELFAAGIPIGSVTKGGVTRVAHIPIHDHNILCLPHVSLGAMGTGKTTQDAVVALGFLRHGFSAVAIDVADGKLIDTIRDGLPADFPANHIIDLDFGNLEYPIPLNWSEITRGLLSGQARSIDARKAANRLSAQLVSFVERLGHDSTPRMESYLTAAGKAVLGRPENGLLEVILALTSSEYREQILAAGIANHQAADTLRCLHDAGDGMQQQIVGPILNRLNLLLGNETMANCLLQRGNPAIDFRRWLDGGDRGPYFIGLRVPKDELLDTATDRLVTFLIAKVWLSVLSRYNQPEEARRPAVMVMDEPHQFMSSKELWGDMVREARKWRLKLYWSAHNFRDFRSLGKTMKDAGCQYSVFRTSKETYQDLAEELLPFTLEDLIRIPDRYYAVNKVVLPGAPNTPAFLAKMDAPPGSVLDRASRREECSRMYGRHIDAVERDIYERRAAVSK
ncbi:MAG: hypothetical protein AB1815_02420 [Bacillota bacterium]